MTFEVPNLAGIITTDDVDSKGSGNYAAKYVNWARIAHLLHVHASGWFFNLKPAPDGGHVWKAPNNTGYLVGCFSHVGGFVAPEFPQAVMDNRNNPVAFDKITARDVTDTHRRCLCTAAAFTFGLAYELWAKEEVENPHRQEPSGDAANQRPAPQKLPKVAPAPAAPAAQPKTTEAAKQAPAPSPEPPAAEVDPAELADPPAPAPEQQEEDDAFATLVFNKAKSIGLNHIGIQTLLTILSVEQFQEVPSNKRKTLIAALVPDAAARLNAGKNSKGEQVVDPQYDPVDAEAPSIDELKTRVAAAFE